MGHLPGLNAYPSAIRGLRAEAAGKVLACFKCKNGRTRVRYVGADGRRWPTCIDCARKALSRPCPCCGDTGPTRHSFDPMVGRLSLYHQDGRVCAPLDVRERQRILCLACGGELRFTVSATMATVHGGVTDRLACSCGATWRLEAVAVGINVYLTA